MSRGFQLQVLSTNGLIWYRDASPFTSKPKVTEAKTVTELREAIQSAADERTLSFPLHVRILTDDGAPVERWKIRSGLAKKLRRRY